MCNYEKQGCPGVLFVTYDDTSLELNFCEKIRLQIIFDSEKPFQSSSPLQSCSKISSSEVESGPQKQDEVWTHFESGKEQMNRFCEQSRNFAITEHEETLSSRKRHLDDGVLQKRFEVQAARGQLAVSHEDSIVNFPLSSENDSLPASFVKNEFFENDVNMIMNTDKPCRSTHSESNSESVREENNPNKVLRRHGVDPGRQSCDLCNGSFSSVSDYLQHTKVGAKNKKCSACAMVFPSVATYLIHNHLQHGSSNEAEVDASGDKNNLVVGYHGLLTGERRHQQLVCPVCKLTFVGHALLAHVMRVHTHEGNYKCCVCDYLAMSPGLLDAHRVKHYERSKTEQLKLLSKAAAHGLNQKHNKEEASSKYLPLKNRIRKLVHCQNGSKCDKKHQSTADTEKRENIHACTGSKISVVPPSSFRTKAWKLLETKRKSNFYSKKNVIQGKGKSKKPESPAVPILSSVHSSSKMLASEQFNVSEARKGFSCYEEITDCNVNEGTDIFIIPEELSPGQSLDSSLVDDKDLNDGKKGEGNNDEVYCKYCKVKFSSHAGYQDHRRAMKHHYECDHCTEILSSRADLILHKQIMHSAEDKIFNIDDENVKRGVNGHPQNNIFSASNKEPRAKKKLGVIKGSSHIACPFCDRRVMRKCLLVHVMSAHTKEGYYKCCICDQQEISIAKWKKHCDLHIRPKKGMVTCKICDETFKDRTEFSAHSMEHHNKICFFCKESFPIRRLLTVHYSSIHLNEMKKCDECGKLFARDVSLKQHKKGHKRRSGQCSKCGIVCKALSHHMKRMHPPADKEPLCCRTCSKTFQRKESLNRHLFTHEKGSHHICHLCGKSLKTITGLSRHMKCHEQIKPYVCHVCGKQSMRKCNLQTHMRIHDEMKKFHCILCGKGFNYKASLQGHMKSRHNTEFEAADQAFTISKDSPSKT